MKSDDMPEFGRLLNGAMAFYGQSVSEFALSVWWQACQGFELEQVRNAMTAHAMDAERGHFAPKPADIIRQLQGTTSDRALIAWGKAYDAIASVGAYQTVVFDDPAIHSAVSDMGGWPKLCRSSMADLQFTQKRFCDAYRAYAARPESVHPAKLVGEHEQSNAVGGYASAAPTLIGNPERAMQVMLMGANSRTAVTSSAALAHSAVARLEDMRRSAA